MQSNIQKGGQTLKIMSLNDNACNCDNISNDNYDDDTDVLEQKSEVRLREDGQRGSNKRR